MSITDNAIAGGTQSVSKSDSVSELLTRGRARACARTREDGLPEITSDQTTRAVQLADLAEYYERSFGAYCPQCARRDIADALDQGMTMDVILIAMDEAAIAPRPSWAYARAILRRCLIQHINTEDDYNRGQINFRRTGGQKGHELPF